MYPFSPVPNKISVFQQLSSVRKIVADFPQIFFNRELSVRIWQMPLFSQLLAFNGSSTMKFSIHKKSKPTNQKNPNNQNPKKNPDLKLHAFQCQQKADATVVTAKSYSKIFNKTPTNL